MKKIVYTLIIVCLLGGGVMLANYLIVGGPVKSKLSADPRNEGIELSAHYRAYVLPKVLVLSLDNTGDSHTQMDVLRCVLQASEA
ncbi:hypothetical protein [Mucilaginibacter terrae]|uniref:Uncharacterized protein n=1 Tax=Mucilaginibacter terrae TaxID=1955052 RepID=A0ABU3GU22_9SPHI|nr:hypothetical protein [Mucilaginibacter terrae]MDT3403278.1 hypothetical protein [Mucilaginibacter terrae]